MPTLKYKTDKMFTDITDDVQALVPKNFQGLKCLFTSHYLLCFSIRKWTTSFGRCKIFLDKLVPYVKQPEGEHRNVKYLHDMISLRTNTPADEPVNGHSHIESLFFNSSESIPINKSKLLLGKWKRLFFIELDPMRKRELILTFISGHQ